jgi:hypothetical protein
VSAITVVLIVGIALIVIGLVFALYPARSLPNGLVEFRFAGVVSARSGMAGFLIVLGVVLVIVAGTQHEPQQAGSATTTPPVTPTTTLAPMGTTPLSIQITDPPNENPPRKVARVISVTGYGDIPQGRHLWLFAYGPGVKHYYPHGKVEALGLDSWIIRGVTLGSSKANENGSIFTIYTVLVDDSTDARITNFLATQPNRGYSEQDWQDLFKKFTVDQRQVQRSG